MEIRISRGDNTDDGFYFRVFENGRPDFFAAGGVEQHCFQGIFFVGDEGGGAVGGGELEQRGLQGGDGGGGDVQTEDVDLDVEEGDGADAEAEELVGFGGVRGGGGAEVQGFGKGRGAAGAGGDELFVFFGGGFGRGRENGNGSGGGEGGARTRTVEFGRWRYLNGGCGYPDADHADEEARGGI
ncbi:hypothetical protein BELL_0030g00300 [Botrytis elliptica]|uniref:Uncharacterized protein n=1 Tax=Botrytis elliptica TaxID=278938 RepID=A0A4Z1K0U7_9HELO|nr:hypothetical protein BELL_0030g00300 [Botrytis elliptica]